MTQEVNNLYIPEATALKFHNDRDNYVIRLIRGVPGSGKSVMCLQESLIWGLAQEPYKGVRSTRWAICRSTYPQLKTTTMATFEAWFPSEVWPIKQSIPYTCQIKFTLADQTQVHIEYIFLALETEKDVEKLKSMDLTGVWLNEVFQMDRKVVTTSLERAGRFPATKDGGCTRSGVLCDTNSPPETHWLRDVEDNPPEGWKMYVQPAPLVRRLAKVGDAMVTIGWSDNPQAENIKNLPGGYNYYRRQIPGMKEAEIQVGIENKYGPLFTGKPVFANDWEDSMLSTKPLFVNTGSQVLVGFDTSGLNPAAVFGQIVGGTLALSGEAVAFDMSFDQYLETVFIPLLRTKYAGCDVLCILDPSNPRDAQTGLTAQRRLALLQVKSVLAPTNNPKIRVESGKHYMNRRGGLIVGSDLPWTRDALRSGYQYAKIKNTDRFADSPDKDSLHSHIGDAYCYLCTYLQKGAMTEAQMGPQVSSAVAAFKKRMRVARSLA